ncbi:MAG: sle1 [Frankiales bacterium]|nr:sle1 [Frankiales bacterium]
MADLNQARADQELLTSSLLEDIALLWSQLTQAERQLVHDYLDLAPAARAAREEELLRLARNLRSRVDAAVTDQLGVTLHGAYEAGAVAAVIGFGAGPVFTGTDRDLLRAVATDTYRDILTATAHVEQTTKELIRALAREATSQRIASSITAVQAGRIFQTMLEGQRIAAIVYRDGSRHGLREYSGMLLRTKTAEVYQLAGFEQAERLGVGWMEILDNPSCGLTSHDDPRKANGLIVPLEVARQYPLSHPNCVRATTPRVDIHSDAEARAASPSTTPAQNADQRLVEQQRQQTAARRAARRRLDQRTSRTPAGLLTPAAGAATSPAARRASARIARRRPGGNT